MPNFTTAFTPPAPITGLTATAVGGALVRLDWDPSDLSAVDFVSYGVRRSTDQGATWVDLATITDQARAYFEDYSAPLDRPLLYQVTQANLDYASDPAEVGTALEGCAWWLVTPGAPEASFELPNVTDYESEWPLQQTEHEPIGRSRKLVESGLLLGEEGTLTSYVYPDQSGVLAQLRAATTGASTEVLLKTPYGEVFTVAVGSIHRTRVPGGAQEVSFRFVEV